ncbi:MAG TPA: RluA family pseudouridine synthase [Pirellulales bacterium]|jgi:23S rRNA pseudouridine1911/1915/1917 synthase|nr:RluA family pseudouridine synthase [Pirellulales bacterium]
MSADPPPPFPAPPVPKTEAELPRASEAATAQPVELIPAQPVELIVAAPSAGMRLDSYLAQQFPAYSRMLCRKAINACGVKVNNRYSKAAYHVQEHDRVVVVMPDLPRPGPTPEDIPLEILYEDDVLAAINKPPGMVVHPSKGHWTGTLSSALQFHFDSLSSLGGITRPGIVHRLDRDTSGVLVVAKTDSAHFHLADQFEQRIVSKEYFAIVTGCPDRDRDLIDLPIGIHPYHREKMAIRRDHPSSRESRTIYEVQERFEGFAALKVLPQTGRTHQIRVHLVNIGHAVLCDRLYGGRAEITLGELRHDPANTTVLLNRQALHAARLAIKHPVTDKLLEFVAPLPADLEATLNELRHSRAQAARRRAR